MYQQRVRTRGALRCCIVDVTTRVKNNGTEVMQLVVHCRLMCIGEQSGQEQSGQEQSGNFDTLL